MLLRLIAELGRKEHGPAPAFDGLDVLRAARALGKKPLPRNKLAAELGIGEGSARSVIRVLEENRLLQVRKRGCFLTKEGEKEIASLGSTVPAVAQVRASIITFGEKAVGALVRKAAGKVRMGIEQRDAALKAGAAGATVLVRRERLRLTGIYDDSSLIPTDVSTELEATFSPRQGDALVLAYSKERKEAERGAWAAVMTLMQARGRK